jgi:hypothetical protein
MLRKYNNGNATISVDNDGSRVIEYNGTLSLDFPLNIDIRVSTQCSFGYNPKTGKAFCDFCHESARTDGSECDYDSLRDKLTGLPKGIELAIGANQFTAGLYEFILWCSLQDYIVNLTVNQGHLKRDSEGLRHIIECGFIKGLGVSYRSSLKWDVPQFILDYENTVFHVIAGIDSFHDVEALAKNGVKKILVLGEKDFGFNQGKVDLTTRSHKEWFWWIRNMFNVFDVVSFDNLALEQLKISRFFSDKNWEVFNQGEHSFYINAVDKYYAPSSRSNMKSHWDICSVPDYFKILKNTDVYEHA